MYGDQRVLLDIRPLMPLQGAEPAGIAIADDSERKQKVDVIVFCGLGSRGNQPQTPGHAQMQDQPAATVVMCEVEQQILPAPEDGVEAQSGQSGAQSGRYGMAQFRRPDDGALDPLPGQVRQETEAADFDFGEFRHCWARGNSITCANHYDANDSNRFHSRWSESYKDFMKPISRSLCLSALIFSLGFPVVAAEPATTPKKKTPASTQAKTPNRPVDVSAPLVASQSGAQSIFQSLLAEVALQRGDALFASSAYADLALRMRDPAVLERAIEVAGYARRFDLAVEAARLWVEVEPASVKAQQFLIRSLVLSGKIDELELPIARLLETDRESLAENLLGLNRMLARVADRPAVFRLIERVCRPYFGVAEAHYSTAMAAVSAGAHERALAESRRTLELRPDWEMAALLMAQLQLRDNTAEAIAFMQDFVTRYPKARDLQLLLARALVGDKRYADARKHFDQLLRDYPDSPDVVYPVAILALQENDLVLAEAQFRHFLTLKGPEKSYANFFLGQISEEYKRNDEALAFYAAVVTGDRYLAARLRSAQLLAAQGRLDEARRQLSGARSGTPEEGIRLAVAEAGLLREARQTQAAFDLLDALLQKQPDQPDLLYETALLAERLDRMDVLETRLRRMIEIQPDSAQAYNALGYSLADRNVRLEEARSLIEKALSLSPEDSFILDSMGWVLYRQGDPQGALGYLQRALARRDDAEISAHLVEVLWVLGRKDEAQQVLTEARSRHPENESLAQAARKLFQ